MSEDTLNNFTNAMYVLIWVSCAGLINSIIEIYTKNKKKQAVIYALILTGCILLYKNIAKKDLVLRNIIPIKPNQ
jgi:hypothetical protein